MIGAFLGWPGVLVTLLLGSLLGSLVGACLMIGGRIGLKSKLPFGVFLALAAVVSLFWGREIIEGYVELTGLRSLAPISAISEARLSNLPA